MSVATIQTAFTFGEVSPSLAGRFDLARMHTAAFTFRNGFVSYRGGFYSRAGTAFVGFSKQTGRSYPPRMIPFQFNINQGLALEFGNFYMRVVSDGGFVTETPLAILGVTVTDPVTLTVDLTQKALSAIANNGSVSSSYSTGDTIIVAGGAFNTRAVLSVLNTLLAAVAVNAVGTGYAPGDIIALAGGTQIIQPAVTVLTTQVVAATINAAGTGGTPGAAAITGTTGSGTKFQAAVTISGAGAISSINSISVAGAYTVNPTLSGEHVTGGGLTGATVNLTMGVNTITVSNPGRFTANSGSLTQATTSGAGTGATFINGAFGPSQLSIVNPGSYVTVPSNPAAQFSTSGAGAGATFTVSWSPVVVLNNGDWVSVSDLDVIGTSGLTDGTYVIGNVSGATFALFDVYGNPINGAGLISFISGLAARIFTLATPYSEQDLAWIKFTQSANEMSLTAVNQITLTEYEPFDLTRVTDAMWQFSAVVPAPSVTPPETISGSASSSGSLDYQYVVTSVADDGTESIASPIANIDSAVDISSTAGTITLTWSAVPGVSEYNVYKASPGVGTSPPIGAVFGYAGSAFGTQFIDTNVVADDTQVPPTHQNPFARGQVIGVPVDTGGSSYSQGGITFVINTQTGSGAVLSPIVVSNALVGFLVNEAGENYQPTDTITITGDGSGATATLDIGAESGTYPGVVAYFQQRRVYADTLNNPDSYFMSQPGSYTNLDSRTPTIDSDAIIGTPWAVQVDGIQWLIPMPGGLVVMTGQSDWQLSGPGGSSLSPQPITPSGQQAQPQAYNGASPTVPPIRIDQSIIHVQAKGSIYRELAYQIYGNMYLGADITVNSSHLFTGYTIVENAYCEEPYKLIWAVRNDGILLSDTWVKAQEVNGWGRHDTNGLFKSVCTVTEPPVDALYLAVQRFPGANTCYTIERMDNRIWSTVEDCWCVDCGLSLPQPTPTATLSASSATGLGAISGVTGLVGGSGYSSGTFAFVVDMDGQGPGVGAVPTLTIAGGIITNISFAGHEGQGYVYPALVISDPANSGSGAMGMLVLDNSATFTISAPLFSAANLGNVIRMGGGTATITSVTDSQHVIANITAPIVQVIPETAVPQAQASGNWTLTAPVSTIGGLNHLIGATVTGVADGVVIPPTVVSVNGTIPLPQPSTSVVAGFGFTAQLQSVYLDTGNEPTVQGQRKKIAAVTVRVEASRGLQVGTNQVDGSTLSPPQIAPPWPGMVPVPDMGVAPYGSTVVPLFTGDIRVPVTGGYNTRGQVAIEQSNPLPMQILAFIPEVFGGDTPQTQAPKRQDKAA